MMLVNDEGGGGTIYSHKGPWVNDPAKVRQGRYYTGFTIGSHEQGTHDLVSSAL
jgi:hypothetical protein